MREKGKTMRLIDADELKTILSIRRTIETIQHAVDNAPTIDVAPVRHGRWVTTYRYGFPLWECSECGTLTGTANFPYCYDCGAKMDEEVD